jgi:hypothetical protein
MRIKCSDLFALSASPSIRANTPMCAEKRTTRSQADLHTDLWGCAARGREDSRGKELCCPWIRRLHPDLRNLVESAPESLRLCRRSLGHLSEIPLIIYGWNR